MRYLKPTKRSYLWTAILLAYAMPHLTAQRVQDTYGQQTDSTQDIADPANSLVTHGKAFSATRYARLIEKHPDGKYYFLRNLRYPTRIGRDHDGRVYMQSVEPDSDCNNSQSRTPPPCPDWNVLVFDPIAGAITHWLEGEIAAHVSVFLRMTSEQIQQAKDSTSIMPEDKPDPGSDGATVTTEDLGEKTVEGIEATGTRTTTVIPAGHSGNKDPIVSIHEIWISKDMNLVIRIIDGDPNGRETIAGLERITRNPDASLFLPPTSYDQQSHQRYAGTAIAKDMAFLNDWFVSQPAP